MGKPKGERSFRKCRRSWMEYMKMHLEVYGLEGVEWIYLAPDRGNLGGCCEHGNEHCTFIKLGKFLE